MVYVKNVLPGVASLLVFGFVFLLLLRLIDPTRSTKTASRRWSCIRCSRIRPAHFLPHRGACLRNRFLPGLSQSHKMNRAIVAFQNLHLLERPNSNHQVLYLRRSQGHFAAAFWNDWEADSRKHLPIPSCSTPE